MTQGDRDIGLAETMVAPAAPLKQAPPTPPGRPKRAVWPFILAGALLIGGGVGIALWATRDQPKTAAELPQPPPPPAVDAVEPTPAVASSPEELLVLERKALQNGDEAGLATLLAPNAFGHGVNAGHVAYTGAATAGMFVTMFGKPTSITSTWSRIGRDGKDVAWIVDELEVVNGPLTKKLMTSQLAFRDGTTWKVAAWHIAELVPNKRAFELAQENALPIAAAVNEQFDDDRQVHDAFRKAFETREAFIEAFSNRADAIDLGSAPGERLLGGPAVKAAFTKVPAVFGTHPGVAAGRVGDRVGWGAANVDYSLSSKGTQTFRVLAILVRESAGWRIVLAQWSNAGPVPTL